MENIKDIQVNA